MTFHKDHTGEAKPVKEKKEKKPKKDKSKEKENVSDMFDATKLRAKLTKLDAKIDDLKSKKQVIVARHLELEGTATTDAAAPPATSR